MWVFRLFFTARLSLPNTWPKRFRSAPSISINCRRRVSIASSSCASALASAAPQAGLFPRTARGCRHPDDLSSPTVRWRARNRGPAADSRRRPGVQRRRARPPRAAHIRPLLPARSTSASSRCSRSTNVRTPRSSFATVHRASLGWTATTSSALATSMPMNIFPPTMKHAVSVALTHPCDNSGSALGSAPATIRALATNDRDAAPANERCSPPRPHRAGAPIRMTAKSLCC